MSWFSKNFEKAALGGAAVIALGTAYLGWAKFSGVQDDFGSKPEPGRGTDTSVAGSDLLPKAQQSLKLPHAWVQGVDGQRPVDLFTGIALFIHKETPDQTVDLLKDPDVHPPIPNKWWLDNRIDPGFGDSPQRDPDGDGFTNREEFDAKTDPNNPENHPTLLDKLLFVKEESLIWSLRPGYSNGENFPYTYEDAKGARNKLPAGEDVAPGTLFFAQGAAANRFKHLGKEVRKEMNKRINAEEEITYAKFEDQRPNKKGTVYLVPEGLPEVRKNEFAQYDRTAVFSLEALGQSGVEFKVEENTTFALPPDSAKKDYLLKKVSPGSVTLEYTDSQGNRKTVDVPKGAMPNLKP